jgi:hypothetical protein
LKNFGFSGQAQLDTKNINHVRRKRRHSDTEINGDNGAGKGAGKGGSTMKLKRDLMKLGSSLSGKMSEGRQLFTPKEGGGLGRSGKNFFFE